MSSTDPESCPWVWHVGSSWQSKHPNSGLASLKFVSFYCLFGSYSLLLLVSKVMHQELGGRVRKLQNPYTWLAGGAGVQTGFPSRTKLLPHPLGPRLLPAHFLFQPHREPGLWLENRTAIRKRDRTEVPGVPSERQGSQRLL